MPSTRSGCRAIGRVIARLVPTDPEPGTIFTGKITAGNDDGCFAIDRRTGVATLAKIARGRSASREISVTCHDNGVPRPSLARSFTVSVGRLAGRPQRPQEEAGERAAERSR